MSQNILKTQGTLQCMNHWQEQKNVLHATLAFQKLGL
jgi:hypothetical protein